LHQAWFAAGAHNDASTQDLKAWCQALGLKTTGKKLILQARLHAGLIDRDGMHARPKKLKPGLNSISDQSASAGAGSAAG